MIAVNQCYYSLYFLQEYQAFAVKQKNKYKYFLFYFCFLVPNLNLNTLRVLRTLLHLPVVFYPFFYGIMNNRRLRVLLSFRSWVCSASQVPHYGVLQPPNLSLSVALHSTNTVRYGTVRTVAFHILPAFVRPRTLLWNFVCGVFVPCHGLLPSSTARRAKVLYKWTYVSDIPLFLKSVFISHMAT